MFGSLVFGAAGSAQTDAGRSPTSTATTQPAPICLMMSVGKLLRTPPSTCRAPSAKTGGNMPGRELEAHTHVLSLPRQCAATLDVVRLLVTQAKRMGMSSMASPPNHLSAARRSWRPDNSD